MAGIWMKFPKKRDAEQTAVTHYRVDSVEFLPPVVTSHEECVAWLLWGATHAPTATPKQQQMLIETAWRLETPFDSWADTTALPLIIAGIEARKAQLLALSPDGLAKECISIMQHLNERLTREAALKKRKGQELKAPQKENQYALFELARYYRGKGFRAASAFNKVRDEPFFASNGDKVVWHKEKLLVLRNNDHRGRGVGQRQFEDFYWKGAGKSPADG
jgi:hypothetical protein